MRIYLLATILNAACTLIFVNASQLSGDEITSRAGLDSVYSSNRDEWQSVSESHSEDATLLSSDGVAEFQSKDIDVPELTPRAERQPQSGASRSNSPGRQQQQSPQRRVASPPRSSPGAVPAVSPPRDQSQASPPRNPFDEAPGTGSSRAPAFGRTTSPPGQRGRRVSAPGTESIQHNRPPTRGLRRTRSESSIHNTFPDRDPRPNQSTSADPRRNRAPIFATPRAGFLVSGPAEFTLHDPRGNTHGTVRTIDHARMSTRHPFGVAAQARTYNQGSAITTAAGEEATVNIQTEPQSTGVVVLRGPGRVHGSMVSSGSSRSASREISGHAVLRIPPNTWSRTVVSNYGRGRGEVSAVGYVQGGGAASSSGTNYDPDDL